MLILLCSICCTDPLTAETIPLSLTEAVRQAVEKNLDLKVELHNPAINEAEYRKTSGIYDPSLSLTASFSDSTEYSVSSVSNSYWSRNLKLNASISQLLPSGATASLGFNNGYLNADKISAATGQQSYWQSNLKLSVNQPLLKNFGRESTELLIDSARISKDASLEKLNTKLMELVFNVRKAYFKLYSLRSDYQVKLVSLELANRTLNDTKGRVKAGITASIELLDAEYAVSSREKELIDADIAVQNQMELLVQLLQLPQGVTVLTTDTPDKEPYSAELNDEIRRALLNRPELKELKQNLALADLQSRVSGNRTRPDLLLSASAATSGLGEGYHSDLDRLSSGKYPAWEVGVVFSYPLGNRSAENEYRKNRLKVDQIQMQIRNLEELIANEVRSAVRALDACYKQLEVARRRVSFAEERLRAYTRKAEVGLATTTDLLDTEYDYATARSDQIKADVAYTDAVTQLWKVTGELLSKERIRIAELDPDRLYRKVE